MINFAQKFSFFCVLILLITACTSENHDEAQGYIEGRFTYIATPVSGVLQQLLIKRGTNVAAGQQLFSLERQPESDNYAAALQNVKVAQASRNSIIANLSFAKLTYERNKILVPKHALQQSDLDRAKSDYESLLAQLEQSAANIASYTATLNAAKWTQNQKTILAPINGMVFDTYYRVGEYTEAHTPILSLLAPQDVKVIFYIPEMNLSRIKLNDIVHVHCDSCEKKYAGKISFIAPNAEYTPPVIYSNDTREKLIYRIEAEFSPEDAKRLHPGQPVTVTYVR